jgi:hypothetical protein
MIKTAELTMAEQSELIETLSGQYHTILKTLTRTDNGAIDSQAFSKALMMLEAEGSAIDLIPFLAQASTEYFEHAVEPTTINGFHGRVEIQAWEMISKACDLFRVLNPHSFQ